MSESGKLTREEEETHLPSSLSLYIYTYICTALVMLACLEIMSRDPLPLLFLFSSFPVGLARRLRSRFISSTVWVEPASWLVSKPRQFLSEPNDTLDMVSEK